MYLFIRMLALIDTGKYLTSIYMVYLYLCSSDAVMQWAMLLEVLFIWFALIELLSPTPLIPPATDDHKRFMSFYDALSSFYLWCWTDSVSDSGGSKTCHDPLWFWNIPDVFFFSPPSLPPLLSCCEMCCTQVQGATMISRWCVFLHFLRNCINQYHLS